MPHCSSEHDEQFESMVGGAAEEGLDKVGRSFSAPATLIGPERTTQPRKLKALYPRAKTITGPQQADQYERDQEFSQLIETLSQSFPPEKFIIDRLNLLLQDREKVDEIIQGDLNTLMYARKENERINKSLL